MYIQNKVSIWVAGRKKYECKNLFSCIGTLTACGGGNDEATEEEPTDATQETTETEEPVEKTEDNAATEEEAKVETTDVNTTASIVNEADAFVKAVSEGDITGTQEVQS